MISKAGLALLMVFASLPLFAAEAPSQARAQTDPPSAKPRSKPSSKPSTKAAKRVAPPPAPVCEKPTAAANTQSFATLRDCVDSPEMVRLPAGKFLMGETGTFGHTYEQPVHEVSVPAFSISRFETTFFEWDMCHADGGCLERPDDEGWGRGLRPVINVNWVDAQQYVVWLSHKTGQGYRLPSEAEWEYAARAGTDTGFSWGDASGDACDFANTFDTTSAAVHTNWTWSVFCVDNFANTAPVGSFPPNPWGLHDMHGNVWEWVQDCWHSDYTDAPSDGSAWVTGPDCEKRVNRGGGWGNNPRSLRSANRDADSATGSGDAFGFRVVRDEPPVPAEPAESLPQTAAPAPSSAPGSSGAAP